MKHLRNISLHITMLVFVMPVRIVGATLKSIGTAISALGDAIALGLLGVFVDKHQLVEDLAEAQRNSRE